MFYIDIFSVFSLLWASLISSLRFDMLVLGPAVGDLLPELLPASGSDVIA